MKYPKDWTEAKLIDVSEKITDGTHQTPKYVEKGIPFISTVNLQIYKQDFDFSKYQKYVSLEAYEELTKTCKPEKGDILISKCGTIGRTQVVNVNYKFGIFVGLGIIKLKKELLDSKYVEYYLNSPEAQQIIEISAPGSTRRTLTIGAIGKVPIFFPNKKEQKLIVEEIETQFTRLDEIVKLLTSIKKNLEVYRKSVLKDVFGLDCEYKKLGTIFETTSGGTPSRGTSVYYTGDIPWLKSGELNDNQQILGSEEHITKDAVKNSSAKIFPKNTVIMAMYGATTGKLGIIRIDSTTNQAVCGILPNENNIPEFIFYYLLLKREMIVYQSKGGAQPNISQGIIKNLDFPVLNVKEQSKILQEIESRFSVIDKLETVVDASLLKSEQLRKSILKSAFEGKLVKNES